MGCHGFSCGTQVRTFPLVLGHVTPRQQGCRLHRCTYNDAAAVSHLLLDAGRIRLAFARLRHNTHERAHPQPSACCITPSVRGCPSPRGHVLGHRTARQLYKCALRADLCPHYHPRCSGFSARRKRSTPASWGMHGDTGSNVAARCMHLVPGLPSRSGSQCTAMKDPPSRWDLSSDEAAKCGTW